jgi:hypothetical protein
MWSAAPQDRLGGVAVEALVVGQREHELDQAVVEERQPGLDRERHAVAVLVAQQRGQEPLQRVEGELARERGREPARRARRRRGRRAAGSAETAPVLALAEDAAARPARRHPRLKVSASVVEAERPGDRTEEAEPRRVAELGRDPQRQVAK